MSPLFTCHVPLVNEQEAVGRTCAAPSAGPWSTALAGRAITWKVMGRGAGSGPPRQHEVQVGPRVHQQRLAGHEGRAFRAEEEDAVRDLVSGARVAERGDVFDALDE